MEKGFTLNWIPIPEYSWYANGSSHPVLSLPNLSSSFHIPPEVYRQSQYCDIIFVFVFVHLYLCICICVFVFVCIVVYGPGSFFTSAIQLQQNFFRSDIKTQAFIEVFTCFDKK